VSKNVSPHKLRHDWCIFVIWLSQENIISWWFSSESKSSESVHNKVNPKHLNSVQWRVLDDDRSEENNEHGNNVDSQLELQEFSDIVEHVSTEFKSSNDG